MEKEPQLFLLQKELGYLDDERYFEQHPEQRAWTPANRYRFMRAAGLGTMLDHPFTYARIHLEGTARMLLDPGTVEYFKLFKRYPPSGGLLGE
ncbi:MAG: hypothetical protein IH857_07225, partial [Deltaproteobacteria bacterium]|nr:hypothetical protein [Deltaproteobacteria bacterium]